MCVVLFCRHERVAKKHQGWFTSCAQSASQSAPTGLLLFFEKEVGQVYSQRQCQTICPALLTVSDLKLLHLKNELHCCLFTVRSVSSSRFTVFCAHGIFVWVFPEMAYTKFMTTCMLHFLESCPRIIPANPTTNHTHDFEAMFWNIRFLNWIRKSWWSSPVAVKSRIQFLCQTMSPEWLCTQNVLFLKVFDTALFFHFSRNSCTPKSYPESYPIHTLNHT